MAVKEQKFSILTFNSGSDWEQWLSENHDHFDSVWLRFFKKDSGVDGITYYEALDGAICYGWIDGQIQKYDEQSYLRKFTLRRPQSTWSKRNKEHVARLEKAGRVQASGWKKIEEAKENGRWDNAYDSQGNMEMPEDFLRELKKNKEAYAFYNTLNSTNRYSIAWRLQTARTPETRSRRMKKILKMMANKEKFH